MSNVSNLKQHISHSVNWKYNRKLWTCTLVSLTCFSFVPSKSYSPFSMATAIFLMAALTVLLASLQNTTAAQNWRVDANCNNAVLQKYDKHVSCIGVANHVQVLSARSTRIFKAIAKHYWWAQMASLSVHEPEAVVRSRVVLAVDLVGGAVGKLFQLLGRKTQRVCSHRDQLNFNTNDGINKLLFELKCHVHVH